MGDLNHVIVCVGDTDQVIMGCGRFGSGECGVWEIWVR